MDKVLIEKVKTKKVLSGLPDSLIWRFLEKNHLDVKATRANLRKYFGVFLTNKVLKGVGPEVLKNHISSRGRDYRKFYVELLEENKNIRSIVDLGCGVNGFSYSFLKEIFGEVNYTGLEASRHLVENLNEYFIKNNFNNARAVCLNLFEEKKLRDLIEKNVSPTIIFMFQIVDALESVKKNSSKSFLVRIKKTMKKEDRIIITMPMSSISGRKFFEVNRKWLQDFLNENFKVQKDFVLGNERIFVVRKN